MKKYYFMVFAALASLVMISCKKNDPVNPTTDLKVTVSPKTLEIAVGDQGKLRAAITPAKEGVTISFVSENEAVATVNASGLVTGVAAGTTNIIAKAEGAVSDTCVVSVVDPYEVFAWRDLGLFKVGEALGEEYTITFQSGNSFKVKDYEGTYYVWSEGLEYIDGVGLDGAGFITIVKTRTAIITEGDYKGAYVTSELNFDNTYPQDSAGVCPEASLPASAEVWYRYLMDSTYVDDGSIHVQPIHYWDYSMEDESNDVYFVGYIKNGWIGSYSNGFFYDMSIVWYDMSDSYYFLKVAPDATGVWDFVEPYEYGTSFEKPYTNYTPSSSSKAKTPMRVIDLRNDPRALKAIEHKMQKTSLYKK